MSFFRTSSMLMYRIAGTSKAIYTIAWKELIQRWAGRSRNATAGRDGEPSDKRDCGTVLRPCGRCLRNSSVIHEKVVPASGMNDGMYMHRASVYPRAEVYRVDRYQCTETRRARLL